MSEPRTEAGKRLLDDITPLGRDEAEHQELRAEIGAAILAIEAEAKQGSDDEAYAHGVEHGLRERAEAHAVPGPPSVEDIEGLRTQVVLRAGHLPSCGEGAEFPWDCTCDYAGFMERIGRVLALPRDAALPAPTPAEPDDPGDVARLTRLLVRTYALLPPDRLEAVDMEVEAIVAVANVRAALLSEKERGS